MVRFSDMLGGNDDSESPRATKVPGAVPYVAPSGDEEADDEETDEAEALVGDVEAPAGVDAPSAPTADESPQDVLDRLTQYATSARAADQPPPPAEEPLAGAAAGAEAAPDADDVPVADASDLAQVGDDLLPHGKATHRSSGRRSKRRP